MDAVLSRHSTRFYTSRPVSKELLDTLLKAAMAAPSAEDERPWHFVVISDRRTREKIATILLYAHVVTNAPAAILVCGDESMQKLPGFWPLDCAAATENILIEAEQLGMGAEWLGLYPIPGRIQAVRNLLKIPEHVTPFALVAVGYPAEKKAPGNRYDESRIHRETWPVAEEGSRQPRNGKNYDTD